MQQVECTLDPFPVLQVEEGVGDGLAVASLQNVFWRKNKTLHLQQILRRRRRNTTVDEEETKQEKKQNKQEFRNEVIDSNGYNYSTATVSETESVFTTCT